MPALYSAKDLYQYFRVQNTDSIEHLLKKDLERTDLSNKDFKINYKTGKNPLYNVLNAYAHFDPEVGYCQGMNIITSWLLKFLKDVKDKCVDGEERTEAAPDKTVEEQNADFKCIIESKFLPTGSAKEIDEAKDENKTRDESPLIERGISELGDAKKEFSVTSDDKLDKFSKISSEEERKEGRSLSPAGGILSKGEFLTETAKHASPRATSS
mmetsp:Transcript_39641/g.60697  ORF Transcript_39641/g.60697 Transcript_39641/m.60697 type:complete len:212 (+) Transcript_39641:2519-3154(+)